MMVRGTVDPYWNSWKVRDNSNPGELDINRTPCCEEGTKTAEESDGVPHGIGKNTISPCKNKEDTKEKICLDIFSTASENAMDFTMEIKITENNESSDACACERNASNKLLLGKPKDLGKSLDSIVPQSLNDDAAITMADTTEISESHSYDTGMMSDDCCDLASDDDSTYDEAHYEDIPEEDELAGFLSAGCNDSVIKDFDHNEILLAINNYHNLSPYPQPELPYGNWMDNHEKSCWKCKDVKSKADMETMIICDGACKRLFHPSCVGMSADHSEQGEGLVWKCDDCEAGKIACNYCLTPSPKKKVVKCSHPLCRMFFCWPDCVAKVRKIVPNQKIAALAKVLYGSDESLFDSQGRQRFICSSHFCIQCFDTSWNHYFWELHWHQRADEDPKSLEGRLWESLKLSTKKLTEASHFKKKAKPPKPSFWPLLLPSDCQEYFSCFKCRKSWCPQCTHPDSLCVVPEIGASLCEDCHHSSLESKEYIHKYPRYKLSTTTPRSALKNLRAILKEESKLIIPKDQRESYSFDWEKIYESDENECGSSSEDSDCSDSDEVDYRKIRRNYVTHSNRNLVKAAEPTTICECFSSVRATGDSDLVTSEHIAVKKALFCGSRCPNRITGFECNPKICSAGEADCGNRIFSEGKFGNQLMSAKIPGKGVGVKATKPFFPGDLVCEYVGEVISAEECHRRLHSSSMAEMDDKQQRHWYIMAVKGGMYIDGSYMGNLARFINHSCSPNCSNKVVAVKGVYRMGIFCVRPIEKGDEITYDYGFQSKGVGAGFRCLCGSPNCRLQIGVSHQNLYQNIHESSMARVDGFVTEQLKDLASLVTNNGYADPYRLKRPHPAAALDGFSEVKAWLDHKARLFDSFEEQYPFWGAIAEKKHLTNAHPNFMKYLHLNGGTLEEYDKALSKKFSIDIPWMLLANDLSWPQRDAARESGIGIDDFFFSARRTYQIRLLVTVKFFFGKAMADKMQSILDVTWGKQEVCGFCGEYGSMTVCESCYEVFHESCGFSTRGKENEGCCLLCQWSLSRRNWHMASDSWRETLATKLSHIKAFNFFLSTERSILEKSLVSHQGLMHHQNIKSKSSNVMGTPILRENLPCHLDQTLQNWTVGDSWEDWSI